MGRINNIYRIDISLPIRIGLDWIGSVLDSRIWRRWECAISIGISGVGSLGRGIPRGKVDHLSVARLPGRLLGRKGTGRRRNLARISGVVVQSRIHRLRSVGGVVSRKLLRRNASGHGILGGGVEGRVFEVEPTQLLHGRARVGVLAALDAPRKDGQGHRQHDRRQRADNAEREPLTLARVAVAILASDERRLAWVAVRHHQLVKGRHVVQTRHRNLAFISLKSSFINLPKTRDGQTIPHSVEFRIPFSAFRGKFAKRKIKFKSHVIPRNERN